MIISIGENQKKMTPRTNEEAKIKSAGEQWNEMQRNKKKVPYAENLIDALNKENK